MSTKSKGIKGEEIAKRHYEMAGFEILEMNYRFKRAEVDLIAMQDEKLLVFVEVKTRTRTDYGLPESFVSDAQKERIKQAAEDYIFAINWHKGIRFDIACVNQRHEVEIFEDAF